MAKMLLLLQILSTLLLLYVGLPMPGVRDKAGNLTRRGWCCLIVGAASLILLMVGNAISAEIEQRRLYRKIDALTEALSQQVMTTERRSLPSPPPEAGATNELTITEPTNGSLVGARHRIAGRVLVEDSSVWVIVHPVETGAFWVQPFVSNPTRGKWQVTAYFGRSGSIDVGKEFEVMAIANPKESISEGEILPAWPSAESRSEVLTVRRKG